MGGGDLLMSFLGVVILSFGFKIHSQRALMRRHAPEIFGATALSSLFSMFGTAAAGKAMGLGSQLSLALVPRCVTVALAMPIAQQLQVADVSLTAAAVVLTGEYSTHYTHTHSLHLHSVPIAQQLQMADVSLTAASLVLTGEHSTPTHLHTYTHAYHPPRSPSLTTAAIMFTGDHFTHTIHSMYFFP